MYSIFQEIKIMKYNVQLFYIFNRIWSKTIFYKRFFSHMTVFYTFKWPHSPRNQICCICQWENRGSSTAGRNKGWEPSREHQFKTQNIQGVHQPDRCTTRTAPAACGEAGTGAGIATRTDRPDWRTASPSSRRIRARRKRCCRGRSTWWSWTSACSSRPDASPGRRSSRATSPSAPPLPRGAPHPRSSDARRASAACCGQDGSRSWSRCCRPSSCTFGTASQACSSSRPRSRNPEARSQRDSLSSPGYASSRSSGNWKKKKVQPEFSSSRIQDPRSGDPRILGESPRARSRDFRKPSTLPRGAQIPSCPEIPRARSYASRHGSVDCGDVRSIRIVKDSGYRDVPDFPRATREF